MGKTDIATKCYMKDAQIFADAFNFYIYGGRQVIDPAQLIALDPEETGILYEQTEIQGMIQKYRDFLKLASFMADMEAVYMLLGIEDQTRVHYAMPVRNMTYDAQQYAGQVADIARKHRQKRDYAGHDSGEYLSGFCREDRILPVITLVVFFGPGRWDGPRSLHEMMSVKNPRLLSLVQDYRIHLIEPMALSTEDLGRFQSSLREVLSFIKYSRDKEKIKELLRNNERFQMLDREAALVIRACTKVAIEIDEEQEEFNMCKAIDDLMADSRAEGMKTGIEKGIEKGIEMFIRFQQEERISKAGILERLQQCFRLNEDTAERYYRRYSQPS